MTDEVRVYSTGIETPLYTLYSVMVIFLWIAYIFRCYARLEL